jgi:hypothetical protein
VLMGGNSNVLSLIFDFYSSRISYKLSLKLAEAGYLTAKLAD